MSEPKNTWLCSSDGMSVSHMGEKDVGVMTSRSRQTKEVFEMKILFVCDKYEANGGAFDIVATDVNMEGLEELLEAWHSTRCSWHVYDTETKEIIKEGSFKPQIK